MKDKRVTSRKLKDGQMDECTHRHFFYSLNEKVPKSTTKWNISWPINKVKKAKYVGNFFRLKTAPSFLLF